MRHIDVVICVKFDRVSRNVIDLLQFRTFLGEHEAEFVSIRESFDTTTPHGKFALNLLASVAEMERDLISERTQTVMHDRAERGLWNSRPPYGYRPPCPERVSNSRRIASAYIIAACNFPRPLGPEGLRFCRWFSHAKGLTAIHESARLRVDS